MNKKILKIMDESKKTDSNVSTNYNSKETNKPLHNFDQIIDSDKQQLNSTPRHKKNNSSMYNKNKIDRNSKPDKNRSSINARKKRPTLTSSCLVIRKRVKKLFEKEVNINAKEILEQFYIKCDESMSIINRDISAQTLSFKQRMKEKKNEATLGNRPGSLAVFNSDKKPAQRLKRNQTIHHSSMVSDERMSTPRFKASFAHMALGLNSTSTKDKKQLKKGKKKILSISEIFDEYMNKFHFIYFQKVCENIIKTSMGIINKSYQSQVQSYVKVGDQIEELNLMFNDDPEAHYQKSLELMINNLRLEIDKTYLQISIETKQELSNVIVHHDSFNFQRETNFIEITDALIQGLLKVFNK